MPYLMMELRIIFDVKGIVSSNVNLDYLIL